VGGICKNKALKIIHLKNKPLDNDCAVGMWMREDRGLVLAGYLLNYFVTKTYQIYFFPSEATNYVPSC